MKKLLVVDAGCDEPGFGSTFDPLLSGVAHGLATLFPPIESVAIPRAGEQAGLARDLDDEAGEASGAA